MRIVSWNVNNAGSANSRAERVWRYLFENLDADIALLQELRDPFRDNWLGLADDQMVWSESGSGKGTAILSSKLPLSQVDFIGFPGSPGKCAVAGLHDACQEPLCIASLHAPTKPSVFPNLDNCISQLEVYVSGKNLLFGGDLNTARIAEQKWPGYSHGEFWDSVDKGRLFDCHYSIVGEERNTLVRKRNELRIQNDHIFTTSDLATLVRSAEVVEEESFVQLGLSDHLPVTVEIDIG